MHNFKSLHADQIILKGVPILSYAASRLDIGSMSVVLSHTNTSKSRASVYSATTILLSRLPNEVDRKDSIRRKVLVAEGIRALIHNGLDSNYKPVEWMEDPLARSMGDMKDQALMLDLIEGKVCTHMNYSEIGNALFWSSDSQSIAALMVAGADTGYKNDRGQNFVAFHKSLGHKR